MSELQQRRPGSAARLDALNTMLGDVISNALTDRLATDTRPRQHPVPKPLIVGFLVLLNAVAMWGQGGWFHERITNHNGWEDWLVPFGVALVIELIGVYLAGMAHAALMADQSAGLLRAGSYAVGGLVGGLNYAHFAGPGNAPNPAAITFGALSTISPWLWAIYSRYRNRDRLAELGLVDKRGVKLSTNKKFWHPIRSIRVMSWAAWVGVTNPDLAVRGWELARLRANTQQAPPVAARRRWLAQPAPDPAPVVVPAEEARPTPADADAVPHRLAVPAGVPVPALPAMPAVRGPNPPTPGRGSRGAPPSLEPQLAPEPARAGTRTDAELVAVLAGVPRDDDGTVPVRRAATALGCGPDRARRLLRAQGLLRTDTPPGTPPAPSVSLPAALVRDPANGVPAPELLPAKGAQ